MHWGIVITLLALAAVVGGFSLLAESSRPLPAPRQSLRYQASPLLVTAGERAAWDLLRRLTPQWVHAICPKVRLEDIVAAQGEGRERLRLRGYVKSRHVDFLLVDSDWRPCLVVEIDGSSHRRPDRRERDELVDRALGAAKVPVIRLRHGERWESVLSEALRAIAPPGRTLARAEG